jgi:hypothetical protein
MAERRAWKTMFFGGESPAPHAASLTGALRVGERGVDGGERSTPPSWRVTVIDTAFGDIATTYLHAGTESVQSWCRPSISTVGLWLIASRAFRHFTLTGHRKSPSP